MRMSREIRQLIGNRLREARIARRQTQSKVAEELGLSRQMVNRYEKGRDAPTAENLAKALRYFGITIELPGYRLTAEALEPSDKAQTPKEIQFELPYGKPQDFSNATVRVTREKDRLEILISTALDSTIKA